MLRILGLHAFRTRIRPFPVLPDAYVIREYRRKAEDSTKESSLTPKPAKIRKPRTNSPKSASLHASSESSADPFSHPKVEEAPARKLLGPPIPLAPHLPSLPASEEWTDYFPPVFKSTSSVREVRPFIKEFDTAVETVRAFGLDQDDGKGPKTIVEIYPGPGMMSRAILSLPRDRIKRLILLEAGQEFHEQLDKLAAADDRVEVVKLSPYTWATYDVLAERGFLDGVKPVLNGEVHPELRIVGQMPMSVGAEQLLSQIVRHIPTRTWLWQYGRVPFHVLLAQWVHERFTAPLASGIRGKLTVLAEATLDYNVSMPLSAYKPYDDHLFPPASRMSLTLHSKSKTPPKPKGKKKTGEEETVGIDIGSGDQGEDLVTHSFRKPGHPMLAVTMIPKKDRLIDGDAIEKWDYILRHLFVLKKSTIAKALPSLAPGAGVLLKNPLLKDMNPKSRISDLTTDDWSRLIQAFEEWPFAPQDLIYAQAADILKGKNLQSVTNVRR